VEAASDPRVAWPEAGLERCETCPACDSGAAEPWYERAARASRAWALGRAPVYDTITFDHSIEHPHEPASAVRVALRLLRPGGLLWVATPNLGSLGARLYGRDWVGPDPPRHLVSFTARGMRTMLANASFGRIRFHAPRIGGKRYWHASQGSRIAEGGSYDTELPLRARIAYRVGDSQRTARWTPGDELLVTARRPLAGP
jgi:SAM-dependent methyltransferase